jgi:hypothetical protein
MYLYNKCKEEPIEPGDAPQIGFGKSTTIPKDGKADLLIKFHVDIS